MNKKYKAWSNEEDKVIIRLRKKGKSIPEIAKALNRTYYGTQRRIVKLINECKVEKKQTSYHSKVGYCKVLEHTSVQKEDVKNGRTKMDAEKILQYVSENPWNIQAAFRKYSEESGFSVKAIHSFYYCRSKTRTRLKDRETKFSIVGSGGHSYKNGKNTNHLHVKSSLWTKLKAWVLRSLLS